MASIPTKGGVVPTELANEVVDFASQFGAGAGSTSRAPPAAVTATRTARRPFIAETLSSTLDSSYYTNV